MLLDASQAFDRVDYVKLFQLFLKRGMCPIITRFLLNIYTNQTLNVRWGNIYSSTLEISNGIKQGGVLSPILFNLYTDELLERLKKNQDLVAILEACLWEHFLMLSTKYLYLRTFQCT